MLRSLFKKILALLQLPGDIGVVISLGSAGFSAMVVATLWALAAITDFPTGPQILFLIGFGVLVFVVVGTVAVAGYRWWIRRKRKAEDRIITIAQGETVKTLRALLEAVEAKWPELEGELDKGLDAFFEPFEDFVAKLLELVGSLVKHTHDEKGEIRIPRAKEPSD